MVRAKAVERKRKSIEQEPKMSTQKNKKQKTENDNLVECMVIKYVVENDKHPNFFLNHAIDKVVIEEILGFNKTINKEQVISKNIFY